MRWLPAVLALMSTPAFAWPADFYFDLEQGEERMHRLAAVDWVEVQDTAIATAEILPSGDLLLSPGKPGRTLLLLYAQGKFAVWRVRVSPAGVRTPELPDVKGPLDAAKKSCSGLTVEGIEQGPMNANLTVAVKTDACRKALLPLLETDAFRARRLDVTFEVEVLQAQLKQLQARADAIAPGKIELRYSGAGLVASGALTTAQHRELLWSLFESSAGAVALDDRLTIADAKPRSAP